MDGAEEEGYRPEVGFEEDSREPLFDLSLLDSTAELWLIQWPHNKVSPPSAAFNYYFYKHSLCFCMLLLLIDFILNLIQS